MGSHCRILIKIRETLDPVCKSPRGQTPRNLLFQRQEQRFREVKRPVRCHAAGQIWQERNHSLPEHLLLLPCATEAAHLFGAFEFAKHFTDYTALSHHAHFISQHNTVL